MRQLGHLQSVTHGIVTAPVCSPTMHFAEHAAWPETAITWTSVHLTDRGRSADQRFARAGCAIIGRFAGKFLWPRILGAIVAEDVRLNGGRSSVI
jgi:hypothetical protein